MENIQPLETVELTQDEIKILYNILTREKFTLPDAQIIMPIAVKLQGKIKVDPTVEVPVDEKKN